ncbi:hypothetical protein [Fischerella sp. JS2]|uniref:hypothetical protein n=1 Tax=Fischerella sp. JS2 TaxID=2597771 RepID=UPI0028E2831A|nr:hypothetical protein [Fischerella sp. JS2]
MKTQLLLIGILASTFSLVSSTALKAQTASNTNTAKTYHPGFWQPVARLNNIERFVKVDIINTTKTPLQYSLSSGDALNTVIPVGGRVTLTTNSLPTYVLIYDQQSQIPLKYNVSTQGNAATVIVQQANTTTGAGDTTLNLQKSGAIYVY